MIIRKLVSKDLTRCAEILEAAYSLPPYEEKFTPAVARAYLESKFAYCAEHSFAAEEDGLVIGFVLVSLSVWVEGGQAIIEEIVVDPARQGRGFGRALMDAAEANLQKQEVHSMMLWGRKDAPAHGFHERHGFADSHDWVIMHKAL